MKKRHKKSFRSKELLHELCFEVHIFQFCFPQHNFMTNFLKHILQVCKGTLLLKTHPSIMHIMYEYLFVFKRNSFHNKQYFYLCISVYMLFYQFRFKKRYSTYDGIYFRDVRDQIKNRGKVLKTAEKQSKIWDHMWADNKRQHIEFGNKKERGNQLKRGTLIGTLTSAYLLRLHTLCDNKRQSK